MTCAHVVGEHPVIAARLREEHRPHGGEAVDAHGVARLEALRVGG